MIPAPTDPRWARLLKSNSDLASASLATRILVSRLRREVTRSPAVLEASIAELRDFFQKNAFAAKDIAAF